MGNRTGNNLLDITTEVGGVEITEVAIVSKQYKIYLTESISESGKYHEIENVLVNATAQDTIDLYLANYGGDCHTAIVLANLLRLTPAATTAHVVSPCYSAASTLALCTRSLIIYPNTFLMFHNYSGSSQGKGNELIAHTTATNRWIHKYFKDIHTPFLTKEECEQISNDKDVYVHFDDPSLPKRIEDHFPDGVNFVYKIKKPVLDVVKKGKKKVKKPVVKVKKAVKKVVKKTKRLKK